jgi:hypothetical protein
MTERLHQRREFERQYEYIFEDPQSQVAAIAPSGLLIADVGNVETDLLAVDQAAVEEAYAETAAASSRKPGGFLVPFIIGFAAAWIARQWKVI